MDDIQSAGIVLIAAAVWAFVTYYRMSEEERDEWRKKLIGK